MTSTAFFRILFSVIFAAGSMASFGNTPVKAGGVTFQVTKTEDSLDGICDSDCSLRDAIAATNTAGSGNIYIPAGTYTLTLTGSGEENNQTGDLDIQAAGAVIINGAGEDQTFIVGSGDRVMHFFFSGTQATITNLAISGGRAPLGQSGGGIYSLRGLYLEEVVFSDNRAGSGMFVLSGDGSSGGNGGAVTVLTDALVIFYGTFLNNQAGKGSNGALGGNGGDGGKGGAVYFAGGGNLGIDYSTFDGNQAGNGGNGASASAFNSAGDGGLGGFGGALYAPTGTQHISVSYSIFSNNQAGKGGNGGNFYSTKAGGVGHVGGMGGAIYTGMNTNIQHSQFYQNHAGEGGTGGNGGSTLCGIGALGGGGGAINASNSHLILRYSQVYENYAGNGGAGGSSGADYACQGGQGGFGGGVNSNQLVTIIGSSLLANHAGNGIAGSPGGFGGGLISYEGEIQDSSINYNTAGDGSSPSNLMGVPGGSGGNGGGLFLSGPTEKTVKITNSTIAYNQAGAGREGSTGQPSGYGGMGGGIYGGTVHAQIIFSTIAHNSAGTSPDPTHNGRGGGLLNFSAMYLHRLSGSILALNSAYGGEPDCFGKIENIVGYNLIGIEDSPNCVFTPLASDRVGTISAPLDPQLVTSSSSTWNPPYPVFWTPLPTSPALDAIPASTTIDGENCTEDQIGVSRPQGSACDIGAVERDQQINASSGSAMIFLFPSSDTRTITLTVSNSLGYRMPGVALLISAPTSGPSAYFSTEDPPVNFQLGPIYLTTGADGTVKFSIRKNLQMGGYLITINGLNQPFYQSAANYGKSNLVLPLIIK